MPIPSTPENSSLPPLPDNAADWTAKREALLLAWIGLQYGTLPPVPNAVQSEVLIRSTVRRFQDSENVQVRLTIPGPYPVSFRLDLLIPPSNGPRAVLLCGDACWHYVSDMVKEEVLRRGYLLALFSRVEIVPDLAESAGSANLYRNHPGQHFGAIAAWAWAYHRCVDYLLTLDVVDLTRIAIAGHSRGGKTTLVAGATDPRIALTCANNSGTGGSAAYRIRNEGSERLGDLCRQFPHWMHPDFGRFAGCEESLPFDQHLLQALVAPRGLLLTEALSDFWSNPVGSWHAHHAAKEIYRSFGVPERAGIHFREGDHSHVYEDWLTTLDFADLLFFGTKCDRDFAASPHQQNR